MKRFKNYLYTLWLLFIIILGFSSLSTAQTIYKQDTGLFAELKSLGFRGGSFTPAEQLIGPAVGYRFNKNVDVTLHAEFLHSNTDFGNTAIRNSSTLNLGLLAGRTSYFTQKLMLRSVISYYHAFTLNRQGLDNFPDPSLNSVVGNTSFYARLPLSDAISLLPNVGGFLGYGKYHPTFTVFGLTHGFDGFQAGPKFGLDLLFRVFHQYQLSVEPRYRIKYNTTHDYNEQVLDLNIGINF